MDLEKTVVAQILDSAKEKIDFIHARLNQNQPISSFPKDKFDTYFAPYFLGQKPIQKDSDIFATWAGIAGSPMGSVHIVDNQNNVVFTVPPLYNTDVIGLANKDLEISRRVQELSQYEGALPGQTMQFVQNSLLPTADKTVKSGTSNNTYDAEWAKIAAHYGIGSTNEPTTVTTNGGIANNSDDDLKYDV